MQRYFDYQFDVVAAGFGLKNHGSGSKIDIGGNLPVGDRFEKRHLKSLQAFGHGLRRQCEVTLPGLYHKVFARRINRHLAKASIVVLNAGIISNFVVTADFFVHLTQRTAQIVALTDQKPAR